MNNKSRAAADGDHDTVQKGQHSQEAGPRRSPTKEKSPDKNVKTNKGGSKQPVAFKKTDSEMMRQSDYAMNAAVSSSVTTWPTTVPEFGYEFRDGVLRDVKTGDQFEFAVSESHAYNQQRYEALGEAITEEVYRLLETEGGLKRLRIPLDSDAKKGDLRSFIFVSDDISTNKDKLMVLIHGSGVVRAGQWTRKLIINNSLTHGSQLPFIHYARAHGYAVVVMNTNLNRGVYKGKEKPIPKSGSPKEHAVYVWKNVIAKAPAKKIAIVAHSFGGVCTVDIAREFPADFMKRVFAVAFTDSVHFMGGFSSPKKDVMKRFEKVAINWVASNRPLDTPMSRKQPNMDARRISAGDTRHEWTTYASLTSILKFLQEMDEIGKTTVGYEMADEVLADDQALMDVQMVQIAEDQHQCTDSADVSAGIFPQTADGDCAMMTEASARDQKNTEQHLLDSNINVSEQRRLLDTKQQYAADSKQVNENSNSCGAKAAAEPPESTEQQPAKLSTNDRQPDSAKQEENEQTKL